MVEERKEREDECQNNFFGRHEYVVTSPIDSVENCRFCGRSRPCVPYVEVWDEPLKADQR
jgi:hypothetical protein